MQWFRIHLPFQFLEIFKNQFHTPNVGTMALYSINTLMQLLTSYLHIITIKLISVNPNLNQNTSSDVRRRYKTHVKIKSAVLNIDLYSKKC